MSCHPQSSAIAISLQGSRQTTTQPNLKFSLSNGFKQALPSTSLIRTYRHHLAAAFIAAHVSDSTITVGLSEDEQAA